MLQQAKMMMHYHNTQSDSNTHFTVYEATKQLKFVSLVCEIKPMKIRHHLTKVCLETCCGSLGGGKVQ